jgi:tetratricopeptide (TPR) repeat protein
VDPERWLKRAIHLLNQKNFADVSSSYQQLFESTVANKHFQALFCYKKAKDVPGIARSQACLHEQEARAYKAAGDYENSTACFEKAITLFLEIGFIDEAASCYEILGQFGKVAGLSLHTIRVKKILTQSIAIWENRGQYVKAAGFYEKGNMFKEASLCYHLCTEYEQAVEVLRRGDQFDELIPYINRYVWRKLFPFIQRRYAEQNSNLLSERPWDKLQGKVNTS